MGSKSRTKGAGGEREFAQHVYGLTGVKLQRNLSQYQNPDEHDLLGIEWAAIEVKRHRTALDAQVASWWEETVRQADKIGKVPVLAYRPDKQQWKVMLPLSHITSTGEDIPITMNLDGFARVVKWHTTLGELLT